MLRYYQNIPTLGIAIEIDQRPIMRITNLGTTIRLQDDKLAMQLVANENNSNSEVIDWNHFRVGSTITLCDGITQLYASIK